MASSKDIFEAKLFGANLFAAGVFRGAGVPPTLDPPPECVSITINGASNVTINVNGPACISSSPQGVGGATIAPLGS